MSRAVWRQADAVTESGVVRDAAYGEPLGRVGALISHRYSPEVLRDGPLVYWRLDETSGTHVYDGSGAGRDGTAAPGITRGGPGLVGGMASATQYPGGDSVYTSLPAGSGLPVGNAPRTFEVWFATDHATPVSDALFGYGAPDGAQAFALRRVADNNHVLYFYSWGNDWAIDVSSAVADLADGQPHHLCLSYDGDRGLVLTLDGTAYPVTLGAPLNTQDSTLAVGGSWLVGHESWRGSLQAFAAYDYALSPERIAAHYAAGLVSGPGPRITLDVPDVTAASYGVALGLMPLYDSTALPAGGYVVYDRRDDADNRVTLAYERPANRWALHRYAGGSDDPLYVADTFTAGQVKHLALGSDTEHLYLQVDGGTRNAGENAMPLVLTSTAHDIGQAGGTGALPADWAYAIPYRRPYTEAEGAHFASLTRPPHGGDVPPVVLP